MIDEHTDRSAITACGLPTLHSSDPGHHCEPVRAQVVATLVDWIRLHCVRTPRFRLSGQRIRGTGFTFGPVTSYTWKHAAESDKGGIGEYVTNGEFIAAALDAGFRARPHVRGSLNAVFDFRPR